MIAAFEKSRRNAVAQGSEAREEMRNRTGRVPLFLQQGQLDILEKKLFPLY